MKTISTSKGLYDLLHELSTDELKVVDNDSVFNDLISNIHPPDHKMQAWVGMDFLKSLSDEDFLMFVGNVELIVSQDTHDYAVERYNMLQKNNV